MFWVKKLSFYPFAKKEESCKFWYGSGIRLPCKQAEPCKFQYGSEFYSVLNRKFILVFTLVVEDKRPSNNAAASVFLYV